MNDDFLRLARISSDLHKEFGDLQNVSNQIFYLANDLARVTSGVIKKPIDHEELKRFIKSAEHIHADLRQLKRFEIHALYDLSAWKNELQKRHPELYEIVSGDRYLQEIINTETVSIDLMITKIIDFLNSMKSEVHKKWSYKSYFMFIQSLITAVEKKVSIIQDDIMQEQRDVQHRMAGL